MTWQQFMPAFLLLLGAFDTTLEVQAQTCTQQHCSSDVVVNAATVNASSTCPNLTAVTLATFEGEDGEVLIELTGPEFMSDAADLVITSPHGGSLTPDYIDTRSSSDPVYCPSSGCKTVQDSYTLTIAELVQSKSVENYCKVPFLVANKLHRSKLDANREVGEAAQGDPVAMEAWYAFHNLTNYAQTLIRDHFSTLDVLNTETGQTITGVKGLLFDVHGYVGSDWVPNVGDSKHGSPLIQWGYRLADSTSLNPDVYCPLDDRSDGTHGTMTHARWMDGHSYECAVRGPGAVGSRVMAEIDARGGLPTPSGWEDPNKNRWSTFCGAGTPSYTFPSPYELANDPAHCDRIANGGNDCHYASGGYDVKVHERMDWEGLSGAHFNTIQAEFPRCIRLGGSAMREELADVVSVALMGFLRGLYGEL
ncbi:hypothetical protein ACHAWF_013836 [Thalassiosira exigua]